MDLATYVERDEEVCSGVVSVFPDYRLSRAVVVNPHAPIATNKRLFGTLLGTTVLENSCGIQLTVVTHTDAHRWTTIRCEGGITGYVCDEGILMWRGGHVFACRLKNGTFLSVTETTDEMDGQRARRVKVRRPRLPIDDQLTVEGHPDLQCMDMLVREDGSYRHEGVDIPLTLDNGGRFSWQRLANRMGQEHAGITQDVEECPHRKTQDHMNRMLRSAETYRLAQRVLLFASAYL